jgi:hypothetical protein
MGPQATTSRELTASRSEPFLSVQRPFSATLKPATAFPRPR